MAEETINESVVNEPVPEPQTSEPAPTAQPVEPLNPEPESVSEPISEPISAPTFTLEPQVVIPAGVIPVSRSRELLTKAREMIQFRKRKKLDKVMGMFLKQSSITNDEVEKLLHISDATATRYLEQLEELVEMPLGVLVLLVEVVPQVLLVEVGPEDLYM